LDELGERVVGRSTWGVRIDVKTDDGYDPDVDQLLAKLSCTSLSMRGTPSA